MIMIITRRLQFLYEIFLSYTFHIYLFIIIFGILLLLAVENEEICTEK